MEAEKQRAKLTEEEKAGILTILGEADACVVVAGKHTEESVVVSLSFKGGSTELTILLVDMLSDESIRPVVIDAVNMWANTNGFTFSVGLEEEVFPSNVVKVDFTNNN